MASNAKPDGYTIAPIPMPVLRVPHLQKVTYDPLKDFTRIIRLCGYTIGVRPSRRDRLRQGQSGQAHLHDARAVVALVIVLLRDLSGVVLGRKIQAREVEALELLDYLVGSS
jgi:hypothetical protein